MLLFYGWGNTESSFSGSSHDIVSYIILLSLACFLQTYSSWLRSLIFQLWAVSYLNVTFWLFMTIVILTTQAAVLDHLASYSFPYNLRFIDWFLPISFPFSLLCSPDLPDTELIEIFLPQPPKCQEYRHVLLLLAINFSTYSNNKLCLLLLCLCICCLIFLAWIYI